MELADATKYKNKIMNELCSKPEVLSLLNAPSITNLDEMKETVIFSRIRIPNTTIDAKNYICFNFNARSSTYNDLYKNVTITMVVICHDSEMKTTYGNRHDALGGLLISIFNWSNVLGFELELVSDTEDIIEKNYYARTLQFKNLAMNSIKNGVKVNGFR